MRKLGPKSLASGIKVLFDVMFYLTVFAGALVTTIMILTPLIKTTHLTQMTQNSPVFFQLDPSAYHISSQELGIKSAEVVEAQGKIRIEGVSKTRMLVGLGFALLLLALIALVLANLREIFKTLKQEDPFVRANAARIRFIGFAVIIGETARAAIEFGYSVDLARKLTTIGFHIRPDFEPDVMVILVGMVLLVIAEVFRLGTKMKEEQELTV